MINHAIDQVFSSQWWVLLSVSALLLAVAELGFRFGMRLYRANDEARKSQIAGVQGATLGLLGLLLAFTFSMSTQRYETRRQQVLNEANAIGGTYLRVTLLPESRQARVRDLLRRYVDVRLDFRRAGEDEAKQFEAERAGAALQRELWTHATEAAKGGSTPLAAIFITSLNEMIDLDRARYYSLRDHVPGAVWLLVLFVASVGCFASGYGSGSTGARNRFVNITLPLLIGVVITLIADLDRPRGGLIGVSQQPMLDLKVILSRDQP
jgi:hypothetical protein